MKVEQLMVKNPACCYPTSNLDDAARIMWEHDCGFVPVVESEQSAKVVGVITDRDACMAAYTRGASLKDLRVADAMAKAVRTCKAGDSIAAAERSMAEARVRRLPVVDEAGALLGVLSLADIACVAAKERKRAKPEIQESEVGDVLASVCQPRQIQAAASAA
jgi:CBS domain-containing protein